MGRDEGEITEDFGIMDMLIILILVMVSYLFNSTSIKLLIIIMTI